MDEYEPEHENEVEVSEINSSSFQREKESTDRFHQEELSNLGEYEHEENNKVENRIRKRIGYLSLSSKNNPVTPIVSENFNNINELNKSIRTEIVKESDGTYSCKRCPRVTRHIGHMKEHIETHIGGMSFPCNICNKTYRTRASLRNHKHSSHEL